MVEIKLRHILHNSLLVGNNTMLRCGHLLNPSLFCVLADRSTSRNNIANNDFVIAGCHPSLRISLMERRGGGGGVGVAAH